MKNFILPEKWYVMRTPENAEIVNKWINSKGHHGFLTTPTTVFNTGEYRTFPGSTDLAGHIKITYQQFLEHIIKQEPVIEDNTELNQILIKLLTE